MSESPLSRYAGPIAVIAGALFAMAAVGLFLVMDRSDLVAMMTDPVFIVFNAAYAITFPLLLIALVAVLAASRRGGNLRSGRLLHRGHRHHGPGRRHVVRGFRCAVARAGHPGGTRPACQQ